MHHISDMLPVEVLLPGSAGLSAEDKQRFRATVGGLARKLAGHVPDRALQQELATHAGLCLQMAYELGRKAERLRPTFTRE